MASRKSICLRCGRRVGVMKFYDMFRRHVKVLGGDGELCEGSWEFLHEQRLPTNNPIHQYRPPAEREDHSKAK